MEDTKQYDFPNFHEIKHPLVQHKLTLLRDKNTSKKEFNALVREITTLLTYEATRNLPLTHKKITTPLETCDALILDGKKPVILPILRAGLGMVDGILSLMPSARVGHIGLYRDEETLNPVFYYFKIPKNSKERDFFICDPMLATGGSLTETVNRLKELDIHKITVICLVAAPEGVAHFNQKYKNIPIYAASLDKGLNDHGYILPGLGDAGDRLFGTK